MPSLTLSNFAKGKMDTASTDKDAIYSLKQLINADIIYAGSRAKIRRRKGYKRYHDANLPYKPKQVYTFVNTSGQQWDLAIAKDAWGSNYRLYLVESNANSEIKNYSESTATSLTFDDYDNYPFETVGNRVFFADDNGWYWADYSSLKSGAGPYTYECYQVGIDKPDDEAELGLEISDAYGYEVNPIAGADLTTNTIGQSFTITDDITIDAVRLFMSATGFDDYECNVIVKLCEDNGNEPGGEISRATANVNAIASLTVNNWIRFSFNDYQDITANTRYWITLEGDTSYQTFQDGSNTVYWLYNATYADGKGMNNTGSGWQDIVGGWDFLFQLGGQLSLDTGTRFEPYRYKVTYYNDTHDSESQDYNEYWIINTYYEEADGPYIGANTTVKLTNIPQPSSDSQISHIRIYRTKANVNDIYYLVGEVAISTTTYVDCIADVNLGDQLQSTDHLRLSHSDETPIVPRYIEHWHRRLWIACYEPSVAQEYTLYYSKRLEGRGSLGVAGDSIYDYFPSDNKFELDSQIRAVRILEDRLIVYTSNNNLHVFDGADSPLNPPPDIAHQELIVGDNCADERTLQEVRGRHIFVTANKELKAFNGSNVLEDIGEAIQASMDKTGSTYSSTVYKNQYVLAVSTISNEMDTLYILDLSHSIPAFRDYQYRDTSGDVLVLYNLHVANGTLLACASEIDDNVYRIIQLDSGYTDDWTADQDDGTDVVTTLQTHAISPARRAKWTGFSMKGYYPSGTKYGEDMFAGGVYGGAANIPAITVTAIGKENYTSQATLAPSSSDDVRGHHCGLRLASEECSVRITSEGNRPDEVREITIEWRF